MCIIAFLAGVVTGIVVAGHILNSVLGSTIQDWQDNSWGL